jgi:hypothetical protein
MDLSAIGGPGGPPVCQRQAVVRARRVHPQAVVRARPVDAQAVGCRVDAGAGRDERSARLESSLTGPRRAAEHSTRWRRQDPTITESRMTPGIPAIQTIKMAASMPSDLLSSRA